MSALAKFLIEKGENVSGSDISRGKYVTMLENMGADISFGHNSERIKPDMTIVKSTAVSDDNPELTKARELGLEIMHRSDLLKYISDEFSNRENSIFFGFSGTHGKTTTSGLCSYVLKKAGFHPSFAVGGFVPEFNVNAEFDGEKYFVAELDESDGTIVKYSPDINVINNISFDHPDFYKGGIEDIYKTFEKYVNNLKPSAKVLVNTACAGVREFIQRINDKNIITFGGEDAVYKFKNVEFAGFGSRFDIFRENTFLATVKLSIPGEHNIYNALGVFSALCEAGLQPESFVQYFETFSGMGRRFQVSAKFDGITVIDDYAHHPEEIAATLEGLKNVEARKVVIFQPHRYSRFSALYNDFLKVFSGIDKLFVTDIYAASEDKPAFCPAPENFVNDIKNVKAKYIPGDMKEVAAKILPELQSGDVVITLGAGTITKIGSYLLELCGVAK